MSQPQNQKKKAQKKDQPPTQNHQPQPLEKDSIRADMLREMLGDDSVGLEWTLKIIRKDKALDRVISGVSVMPGLLVSASKPRAVDILQREINAKVAEPAAAYIQEEINRDVLARLPTPPVPAALPAPADDVIAEEGFGGMLDAEAAKVAADVGEDLEEDEG